MLSLDTHIVVALLDGSLRKAEERRVASEEIAISGIVLWELAKLVQLGRLEFDFDATAFVNYGLEISAEEWAPVLYCAPSA
jgi:PIN domain nuclease of toxin-antitoxin system